MCSGHPVLCGGSAQQAHARVAVGEFSFSCVVGRYNLSGLMGTTGSDEAGAMGYDSLTSRVLWAPYYVWQAPRTHSTSAGSCESHLWRCDLPRDEDDDDGSDGANQSGRAGQDITDGLTERGGGAWCARGTTVCVTGGPDCAPSKDRVGESFVLRHREGGM